MTSKDITYEWEIKRTRNDFKQDILKRSKYGNLGKYDLFRQRMNGDREYKRNTPYRTVRECSLQTPSHFSYVVPDKLIGIDDLPEFAGLYYIDEIGVISEVRRPVNIHRDPLPEIQTKIGQKLMYRFWNERKKNLKGSS